MNLWRPTGASIAGERSDPVRGRGVSPIDQRTHAAEFAHERRILSWGRCVDLGQINASFLNVVAQHDHITPYASAHPLVEAVGGEDKEEMLLKGGHVSLLAGRNAVHRLWPQLDRWLSVRSV